MLMALTTYDFSKLLSQSSQFKKVIPDCDNTSIKFDRLLDNSLQSLTDYSIDNKSKHEFASYIDTILSDYPSDQRYYKSQRAIVKIFYKDFNHALANMQYRDLLHFASRIRLGMNSTDLELLQRLITNLKDLSIPDLIERYIDLFAIEERLFNFTVLTYLICIRYLRILDCDRLNQ